jgi:hypothetical protein
MAQGPIVFMRLFGKVEQIEKFVLVEVRMSRFAIAEGIVRQVQPTITATLLLGKSVMADGLEEQKKQNQDEQAKRREDVFFRSLFSVAETVEHHVTKTECRHVPGQQALVRQQA